MNPYLLHFISGLLGPLTGPLAGPMASALPKPLAYLDPGSGSFILQIILASLLASLVFFRSFWSKLLGVFRKPKPSDDDDLEDDGDEHSEP